MRPEQGNESIRLSPVTLCGGAMSRMRTTKIIVETEQFLAISRRSRAREGWCASCSQEVHLVTAEQATLVSSLSLRRVCVLVETGLLHFTETDDGLLWICLNSLLTSTIGG